MDVFTKRNITVLLFPLKYHSFVRLCLSVDISCSVDEFPSQVCSATDTDAICLKTHGAIALIILGVLVNVVAVVMIARNKKAYAVLGFLMTGRAWPCVGDSFSRPAGGGGVVAILFRCSSWGWFRQLWWPGGPRSQRLVDRVFSNIGDCWICASVRSRWCLCSVWEQCSWWLWLSRLKNFN